MTTIAFHFNVSNRHAYACTVARQAAAAGSKLVVLVEPDDLVQLDCDLWQLSAVDFVPHCGSNANANVVARSPVFLTSTLRNTPHQDMLVNLGESVPDGFAAFDRVIEVVGLDDSSRQAARQRWRHYVEAGMELVRHDAKSEGAA